MGGNKSYNIINRGDLMNRGLQKILEDKGLTAKKLAEKSQLSYNMVIHALDRPTENWKVSSINKFAIALNMTPVELLSKLEDYEMSIKTTAITYSDNQLSLQGYKFKTDEKILYENLKKIFLQDRSGYIPTKKDVEDLVHKYKELQDAKVKEEWEKSVMSQLLMLTKLQKSN